MLTPGAGACLVRIICFMATHDTQTHDTPTNAVEPVPARATATAPYPFAGIVGQAELKLALLLCVVDPTIGGIMVMGHRGTAKSTAVRALAALLPPV